MSDFGILLGQYRRKCRIGETGRLLTQEILAENLSVSVALVGHWETSKREPKDRLLLVNMVTVLHRFGGITNLGEANKLLHLGGFAHLDQNEIAQINSSWMEKQSLEIEIPVENPNFEQQAHWKTDDASVGRGAPQSDPSARTLIEDFLQNRSLWESFKLTHTTIVTYLAVAITVLVSSALGVIYWQSVPNSSSVPIRWCDSFDQPLLDEQKWGLLEDVGGLVYVKTGQLNFESALPTDGEVIGAELISLPAGHLIKEITLTATLVSSVGTEPASAGIKLFLQNGRDFAVMFGSGSGGPEVEIYKCPYTACNDEYEKYQTNRLPVTISEPILVQVTDEENMLNFTVGDVFYEQEPVDAQLSRVQFSMFAEPGSAFHVAVDEFCVTYEQ